MNKKSRPVYVTTGAKIEQQEKTGTYFLDIPNTRITVFLGNTKPKVERLDGKIRITTETTSLDISNTSIFIHC